MAATMIDLDDEALEQARRFYGTTTKKDTVNSALRDAAAREARRRTALGDFLLEQAAEYDRMSEAEKAAFRAQTHKTDHTSEAQLAQPGRAKRVRDAAGKPAA